MALNITELLNTQQQQKLFIAYANIKRKIKNLELAEIKLQAFLNNSCLQKINIDYFNDNIKAMPASPDNWAVNVLVAGQNISISIFHAICMFPWVAHFLLFLSETEIFTINIYDLYQTDTTTKPDDTEVVFEYPELTKTYTGKFEDIGKVIENKVLLHTTNYIKAENDGDNIFLLEAELNDEDVLELFSKINNKSFDFLFGSLYYHKGYFVYSYVEWKVG